MFIELIDVAVRIVAFRLIQGLYSNGEGHYTSNSEVRASSWSNFTKIKIDGDFSFLFTLLEGKLGSQKPNKDGNESQTHGRSNALLHFSVRKKVEIVLIFSQKVTQSRISVFFAVFICFLDGIVRIVVFLPIQGWTGHDGSGTQRGAPNSSIFLFNF